MCRGQTGRNRRTAEAAQTSNVQRPIRKRREGCGDGVTQRRKARKGEVWRFALPRRRQECRPSLDCVRSRNHWLGGAKDVSNDLDPDPARRICVFGVGGSLLAWDEVGAGKAVVEAAVGAEERVEKASEPDEAGGDADGLGKE
jgi:hypothetical protein